MIQKKYVFLILFCALCSVGIAQPALPDFNIIKGPKNHTILSWKNNFGDNLIVLNVQRSTDSVVGFRTIYSADNPTLSVNAFTDNKPQPGADYYRLYYMMKNGSYYFTEARRISTGFVTDNLLGQLDSSKTITVEGDLTQSLSFGHLYQLKDSVLNFTSDTLRFVNDSTLQYIKYNAVAAIASTTTDLQPISKFIYMNGDGNIVLKLPQRDLSQYSMIIYKRNGTSVLFKINRFDQDELILSKSSFMYSGWYPYEIFQNGKLLERSRLEIK